MTSSQKNLPDNRTLERSAAAILAAAIGSEQTLHLPGVRERYRRQLEEASDLAYQVLDASDNPALVAGAQWTLVRAHAARAQDARYGAGQLSRGSQRAPTMEDCEDGWQRIEEIVKNAEESAAEARRFAKKLDHPAAAKAAETAEVAARNARQIVNERNHAYTFHTDPGFSFGEGWHVAASALLAGVAIQLEPDKAQCAQAERFLRDAGLGTRLTPYRPRPRTNKQLTAIVAGAFRADPIAAQRTLRTAFLGEAPRPPAVVEWTRRTLAAVPGKKVLVWVRHTKHNPERNTEHAELVELSSLLLRAGLVPVFFGDALPGGSPTLGTFNMTLAWKEPLFQGEDMRRAQLQLFEELRCNHGLVGQLGVTSAGMDGPALLGLPTMYLTDAPNPRLRHWVGVVPNYQEVVREAGYLEVIADTLMRWSSQP
ncbi:hypothetical protein KKF84_22165 [Myxococcota bacterium]|nr:hypothetical protein [Myxococcota bacterium]MBU1538033.1 hypothetical protein [Myxococcota bacterium]